MAEGLVLGAAAWLATAALHGVLIVTLVALATRRMRSGPARERAWKLALFGALVTATAQLGLGVDPVGGAIVLHRPDAPTASRAVEPDTRAGSRAVEPLRVTPVVDRVERPAAPRVADPRAPIEPEAAIGRDAPLPFAVAAGAPLLAPDARPEPREGQGPLARLRRALGRAASLHVLDAARAALVAWAAIAAALLALWSLRWRRLARRIAGRRPLDGEPRRLLDELRACAGLERAVRSSVTPALAAPITFGILRSEVCLPERALTELAPDELRAMLAHELAHVVRRDPLWLALAGFLERLLFVQPLARLARRRWQEEAELACDDLAVRWTDERLALATCLTEVAGWLLHEPRALAGLPVPSMAHAAHGRAGLGRRVRRLIDEPPTAGRHASRWMAPLLVAGLASIVAAAPRIAPRERAAGARELARHPLRALALDALERAAEHVERLPSQTASAATADRREDGLAPFAAHDERVTMEPADAPAPATPADEGADLAPVPGLGLRAEEDADPLATPLALAPEARHVIGPHGLAQVVAPRPEPGLDDMLLGLERAIAMLEAELGAIASEARALDGWAERVARLELRIRRLGEQHERLATMATVLVELDAADVHDAPPDGVSTTTDVPFGTPSFTLDEDDR